MKKIVAIDDNVVFLNTLKQFIDEIAKDCNCITFSNPEDALRHVLEEKGIYAVVTDCEMPQMNGLLLAQKIIERIPEMKVIVMSGHDADYLRKRAKTAGVDETKISFLCKSNIINLISILAGN